MVVELIASRKSFVLHIEGFLFYKHSGNIGAKTYWECVQPSCTSTAITFGNADNLQVVKGPFGPKFSLHEHAPNWEEVNARKQVNSLKRAAEDNSETPPSVLIRNALRNVPSGKNYFSINVALKI